MSWRSTCTPGRIRRNSFTACGTIVPAAVVNAASRSRPRALLAISVSSACACASSLRMLSVRRTSASPAGVSLMPFGWRSISLTPVCASSRAICCETAGCE